MDAEWKLYTLERRIEDLELSVRTYNRLKLAQFNTVADLAKKTEQEMLKIKGLGRQGILEVRQALAGLGIDHDAKGVAELEAAVIKAALKWNRAEGELSEAVFALRLKLEQIHIATPNNQLQPTGIPN